MTDMTPIKTERSAETGNVETKPATGRAGRLFGFGVLALLAAGLAFGAWRYYAQSQQTLSDSAARQDLVPTVRTAMVKAGEPTMQVSLPGTTAAFATANIFARATGYSEKRYVDIGDRVKQGQLLAEITAPEIEHQLQQAQATLAQSEAALRQQQANADLANVTWGRDKPLVDKGWVTAQQGTVDQQNLEAQQAAVGVAQSNVAAQQAQIKVLQQAKDYLSVVAPFDGVVTRRNIDVGSLVQADATSGTFMFTVMQTNVIRTQVYVPQDQAFGVGPGVEAVVRVPELPDRGFPGTVTRISDALDPLTRTLLTEIDVPNPDGALPSGVYCTVELHIPRKAPALAVPADAIIFDAQGVRVATIENGVVRMHKVSIVRDDGTQVEVSDGLKDGDQVILNPSVNLAEGDKVEARPELTAATN
jgi:RND family efflux transporter MFP subunit